jgi:hypothetical protein
MEALQPHTNSSPISKIPNELLNNILQYVVSEPERLDRWRGWRKRQTIAASISLTSKRFHQIVQPLLYHSIHLAGFDDFKLITQFLVPGTGIRFDYYLYHTEIL